VNRPPQSSGNNEILAFSVPETLILPAFPGFCVLDGLHPPDFCKQFAPPSVHQLFFLVVLTWGHYRLSARMTMER
ncbi:MAG: hypothetical protein IKH16_02000, partial [Selenomonadaceae bacterium]|nr:hypothetical protein [Selenomonadaceae bacterium]